MAATTRCDQVTVSANIYGATLVEMNANAQAFADAVAPGALAVDISFEQITGNPTTTTTAERIAAAVTFRFVYPSGTV